MHSIITNEQVYIAKLTNEYDPKKNIVSAEGIFDNNELKITYFAFSDISYKNWYRSHCFIKKR